MSKVIITFWGKASQVLGKGGLADLFFREYGNLTLGELSKGLSKHGCWILWEAQDG